MKSLFPLALIVFTSISISAYAQIGINTTDPTKDLDVNGEMRVRDLPVSTNKNISLLATDGQGNIQRGNIFFLSDIIDRTASSPKRINARGYQNFHTNLNLGTTVIIPANKRAKVIVNYSVPAGADLYNDPPSTYLGVTFKRNGNERPSGSRKVTLPNLPSSNVIAKMTTISNTYTETFPPRDYERTITYSLYGYVEQSAPSNKTYNYIFNMYSASGANYNWGKASMIAQVYIK